MSEFIPFTQADIASLVSPRAGETKIGQCVHLANHEHPLETILTTAKAHGAQFAIVGVGEDIGPRANLGRGGATDAFTTSMRQWLNLQSNRFLSGAECLILGQVHTADLQLQAQDGEGASLTHLRQAVERLDERVIKLVSAIQAAGLEPIVIGGGHNNAYGLLMATSAHYQRQVAAVNLDPHSDFRLLEGRHSGNGFSYAANRGALGYYHVLGLHELKNSEANLQQLTEFGGTWHSLQQIWIRREISLTQALQDIANKLNQTSLPVALELDVDAIAKMPSSASTAAGIPLLDAAHYISYIASRCPCAYLHLAEAAPSCHEAGIEAGFRDVGQSISELIYAYVQARCQFLAR
ncbi:formimidoylglutamase [Shewanella sp. DNRA4]|mgnify:FL=1|uniref:formimidoylglutamase n=1 Tax=Shewanella TaxID=22 RepID=UPI00146D459A|nr:MULTISPECIES: formimidoylglutamase [Shewanella]MCT8867803.1 formimidoylglutamase [Shewanella xiamenensis]MDN5498946.1 formimidoylglutamase [Shewanella sp.]MDN5526871.1 formimidoylglutamase [Shewanella sp.]NMD53552.1 formimidoylglutamase [Shewanella sp. DNRA4]BDA59052.1 formimidoylglutamase HutG [Shewanella xiamenensis]